MAQHDYTIANQGFPAFRSDLNDALAAIVSNNSGATEPTTMFAHQMWVDTAANPSVLKIRNADNDAWITIGSIDQTGDTFTLTSAVSATTLNTSGAVVFNDAGADVDFRVEGDTNANLLFVDASADAVGVNTGAPESALHITRPADEGLVLTLDSAGVTTRSLTIVSSASGATNGAVWTIGAQSTVGQLAFATNANQERLRIDSSGNVMVGKTSSDSTTVGFEARSDGRIGATYDGGNPVYFNRLTSDGEIVRLQKDGTTVGSIGSVSGLVSYIVLDPRASGAGMRGASTSILPANEAGAAVNDAIDLGTSATRWQDIYLVNSPNVSSDRNLKQDIEELSEAEQRVAVACKALLRKWRFKDAVAKKGDDARIHFGIIAQDLKAAFEAEGLDAHRYGMFMWNEWWETQTEVPAVEAQEAVYETQTDEEGNEVQVLVSEAVEGKEAYTRTDTYMTEAEAPEGAVRKERMGIRYNELLAFIIAAI